MSFFGDIASGLSAGVSAIGRGISSAWENVGVPVIRDVVLPAAGQALGAQIRSQLGPRQTQQQARTQGRVLATQLGVGSTAPAVTQPRISRTTGLPAIQSTVGSVYRPAVPSQGFVSQPMMQPAGLLGGLSSLLRPEITEAFGDVRRGWCETFPESRFCPQPGGGAMSTLPGGVQPRGALVGQTGSGVTTPAFQQTPAGGLRPARIINAIHPITGRIVWWRNMGRPILWSGDLSSCARVNRIAARSKRVSRGGKTARKKRR